MPPDEPAGSLSDVLDARRTLAAALKVPRWIGPLAVLGGAAAMAALTGGKLTGAGFATAVLIILATIYVPILVLVWRRRALGVRLRRRRPTKQRWLFTGLMFVVFVGTAYGLMRVLPLGTPLACSVEFVAAAIILGISMAVNARDPVGNNAGRLVRAEDYPGEFDELIASRLPLKLCTSLAAIEEI
jgi:drug/metabolite transporter (DMT)-like permease